MGQPIAIEPDDRPDLAEVISEAGATPTRMSPEVRGLVWTDYWHPEGLTTILDQNPQLEWVQLPFAGVDPFVPMFRFPVRFTSCKGSFREPVAEHALTLCLALGRAIPKRVRAKAWGDKFAVTLFDADVLIVGAGGITEELISLLKPFRSRITVARNRAEQPMPGAAKTIGLSSLAAAVSTADFVILACALTPETHHLFDEAMFQHFKPAAYLVNVARGPIIDTDALLTALDSGLLAGAAADVTEPEPLPEGHPAWNQPNLIITPHTADTPDVVAKLFAERLAANIGAFLGSGEWVGQVDPTLGY